ncbi:MAG: hypothetical protein ACOYOV_05850 [Bacteroidales bacterium]
MIIIVDDTFDNKHNSGNVKLLNLEEYNDICHIYSRLSNLNIITLVKKLDECELFCNHKSLQIFNKQGNALNEKDNVEIRNSLYNRVELNNIPRIEFSRDLSTNFVARTIDKQLFYSNLKSFLDYYKINNIVETKILFWGENFKDNEKLSIIQNLMFHVRMTEIENFNNNKFIKEGINILFPLSSIEEIIEKWKQDKVSKNEIIREINHKIN